MFTSNCSRHVPVPVWITGMRPIADSQRSWWEYSDPDGSMPYRLIGLECCLLSSRSQLEVLTFLVDQRILEWVRENNVVPNTQIGFQEGKRTNNNSFVLPGRCAIEKAWAEGKSLYVVFIDLKNASPATV
ncbi:hypothetical protein B0H19DRAFT_1352680 [Mycena capillaripes]|nr:hypothetical protein B0H19DRAFT_1352680 [Mycena capillaripes]